MYAARTPSSRTAYISSPMGGGLADKEERETPSGVKAMSDTFSCNSEREIARCQSERPDIYDVHYDAIEQLKAIPKLGAVALLQSVPVLRLPNRDGSSGRHGFDNWSSVALEPPKHGPVAGLLMGWHVSYCTCDRD